MYNYGENEEKGVWTFLKNELTNKWDDIDESLWVGVLRSLRMVAKEEKNTELNKEEWEEKLNIIATFDNYEFDDNERNDFKIKINNARKEEEDKYKTFLNKVLNDGSWREGLYDGVIEIIEDKESSEDITHLFKM